MADENSSDQKKQQKTQHRSSSPGSSANENPIPVVNPDVTNPADENVIHRGTQYPTPTPSISPESTVTIDTAFHEEVISKPTPAITPESAVTVDTAFHEEVFTRQTLESSVLTPTEIPHIDEGSDTEVLDISLAERRPTEWLEHQLQRDPPTLLPERGQMQQQQIQQSSLKKRPLSQDLQPSQPAQIQKKDVSIQAEESSLTEATDKNPTDVSSSTHGSLWRKAHHSLLRLTSNPRHQSESQIDVEKSKQSKGQGIGPPSAGDSKSPRVAGTEQFSSLPNTPKPSLLQGFRSSLGSASPSILLKRFVFDRNRSGSSSSQHSQEQLAEEQRKELPTPGSTSSTSHLPTASESWPSTSTLEPVTDESNSWPSDETQIVDLELTPPRETPQSEQLRQAPLARLESLIGEEEDDNHDNETSLDEFNAPGI